METRGEAPPALWRRVPQHCTVLLGKPRTRNDTGRGASHCQPPPLRTSLARAHHADTRSLLARRDSRRRSWARHMTTVPQLHGQVPRAADGIPHRTLLAVWWCRELHHAPWCAHTLGHGNHLIYFGPGRAGRFTSVSGGAEAPRPAACPPAPSHHGALALARPYSRRTSRKVRKKEKLLAYVVFVCGSTSSSSTRALPLLGASNLVISSRLRPLVSASVNQL